MKPAIDLILTAFTIIGMVCSLLITIGALTLIVVIVHDNQWQKQKAREKQQQREADEAFWEAYKQRAIQEVDRIMRERKPGGDTDPQVPIVG